MLVLNYAHPLTAAQRAQIEALAGEGVDAVREVPVDLDVAQPFAPQVEALAEAAGLTPQQWQTTPLLLVMPSLNYAAVALLAEVHGRVGHFPPVVRLRPVADAVPPRYEVAELLDLQTLRETARRRRFA
jgi:hypothetical protein